MCRTWVRVQATRNIRPLLVCGSYPIGSLTLWIRTLSRRVFSLNNRSGENEPSSGFLIYPYTPLFPLGFLWWNWSLGDTQRNTVSA